LTANLKLTKLKEKYPNIQRIAYLCKHETACFVGEGMMMKQQIKKNWQVEMYMCLSMKE
jgi:hypothetical protein